MRKPQSVLEEVLSPAHAPPPDRELRFERGTPLRAVADVAIRRLDAPHDNDACIGTHRGSGSSRGRHPAAQGDGRRQLDEERSLSRNTIK